MRFPFNNHWKYEEKHAFLSASSYHWLNYDRDKLRARVGTSMESALGTRKHNFAKEAIEMGIRQRDSGQTLNSYINDCIGHRMQCEVLLFYSENCFGTTDAIDFRLNPRSGKMRLRVFDLKTGTTKTSVKQLWVYIALFCLEYEVDPKEIEIDARIYQNDMVNRFEVEVEDILETMQKITDGDLIVQEARMEVMQ